MSIPHEPPPTSKLAFLSQQATKGAFHGLWVSIIASLIVAVLAGSCFPVVVLSIAGGSVVLGVTLAVLLSLPNLPNSQRVKSETIADFIEKIPNESGPTDLKRKLDILKQFDSH